MPVPDGQREKKETGAAAGIARSLRPAASREKRRRRSRRRRTSRRRRRRAKGPAPPLPGCREVERAGGRWLVRPCAGPPARPSSRRRGSAGPMRKRSSVSRGPCRPLPATSCRGWGGGCPFPRPRRPSERAVAAAAGAPERHVQSAEGVCFLKGATPFPPVPDPVLVLVTNPWRVRVDGRDFGRLSPGGAAVGMPG